MNDDWFVLERRISESGEKLVGLDDGSCAICVYLIPKHRLLVCANLGDSRAIAGRMNRLGFMEPIALSTDHATGSDSER